MATDTNEYVSILVPKQYLTKIYGFIASLDNPHSSPEPLQAQAAGNHEETWDRELIIRQFIESPDSMKKFQKFLADHPGEAFSTSQMAEALGVAGGWNSVAGALGAYGHRVKNRYQMFHSFPFQSKWDHGAGESMHSMTPDVAEIIKSL